MSAPLELAMGGGDWLSLFGHYLALSLMSVGGLVTTIPDMHRYLVEQQHWVTEAQFTSSIALGQAMPGPNVLFIALLGWNVGWNAGGAGGAFGLALLGTALTLGGILLPSCTLTVLAARWGHRNRELRAVRAFKQGMGPVVVALLLASGWILAAGSGGGAQHPWMAWGLAALTALLVWRTQLHILWLLGAGALLGWMGLV